jgi:hypothetical protein
MTHGTDGLTREALEADVVRLSQRVDFLTALLVAEKRKHYVSIGTRLANRTLLNEELFLATKQLVQAKSALLDLHAIRP